jgi:transposase
MTPPENLTSLSRDALMALVAVLQRQVAELSAANDALRADIARLTRDGKRQAAPFSKGSHVSQPKRPGRKPGSGIFHYREAPLAAQITALPVDVPVLLAACPAWGGQLAEERVDFAYMTDIPDTPRLHVTQYRVSVCRCLLCGKQVRGQHPYVAPDQYGAMAHCMGDRVRAAPHALHYGIGLPVRTVPRVLAALPGITLPQGAITRDAMRRTTGEIGAAYERLRATVPASPVGHTDDTGWRIGGEPASLMAFDTDEATVYQIRSRHRHEEVQEGIPPDYAGVKRIGAGVMTPKRSMQCPNNSVWPTSCGRSVTCRRRKKAGSAISGSS